MCVEAWITTLKEKKMIKRREKMEREKGKKEKGKVEGGERRERENLLI